MNLEDRLRTHLHSGEDLFVEGDTSATDISAAGARRTKRNQIGAGLVASVAAISLVFGASAITNSGTSDFATEPVESFDSAVQSDEAMSSGPGDAEALIDPGLASGDVTFEIITGVGDGFAGIRKTAGALTAITSSDGIDWVEVGPIDLPSDQVDRLTESNGVYAVSVVGQADGRPAAFIGTSTDLSNWTVVEVEEPGSLPAVSALEIHNGMVVGTVWLLPTETDEAGAAEDEHRLLVGPVGGPYELIETEALPGSGFGLVSTDTRIGLWAQDEIADSTSIGVSTDGGQTWSPGFVPNSGETVLDISAAGDDLLVFVSTERLDPGTVSVARSTDDPSSWSATALPDSVAGQTWWSVNSIHEGGTTVAAFSGPGDLKSDVSIALVVSTGEDFTEVDLTAHMSAEQIENSMLAAVSEDEALFQFFGAPSDDPSLASSSGPAPGDSAGGASAFPQYIRIPLQ